MGKPEWRPENAYDDQNPEMYYAFDEGAQAMAKALIERLEKLALEYRWRELDGILKVIGRLRWEIGGTDE